MVVAGTMFANSAVMTLGLGAGFSGCAASSKIESGDVVQGEKQDAPKGSTTTAQAGAPISVPFFTPKIPTNVAAVWMPSDVFKQWMDFSLAINESNIEAKRQIAVVSGTADSRQRVYERDKKQVWEDVDALQRVAAVAVTTGSQTYLELIQDNTRLKSELVGVRNELAQMRREMVTTGTATTIIGEYFLANELPVNGEELKTFTEAYIAPFRDLAAKLNPLTDRIVATYADGPENYALVVRKVKDNEEKTVVLGNQLNAEKKAREKLEATVNALSAAPTPGSAAKTPEHRAAPTEPREPRPVVPRPVPVTPRIPAALDARVEQYRSLVRDANEALEAGALKREAYTQLMDGVRHDADPAELRKYLSAKTIGGK